MTLPFFVVRAPGLAIALLFVATAAWASGATRHVVTGTITADGAPLSTVWLTGLPGGAVTGADGAFRAVVPDGWSGVVAPRLPGYRFTPRSVAVSAVSGDLVIDFIGEQQPLGRQRLYWVDNENDLSSIDTLADPGDFVLIEPGSYTPNLNTLDDELTFLGRGDGQQVTVRGPTLLRGRGFIFGGIGFEVSTGDDAVELGVVSDVRFQHCHFRSPVNGSGVRTLTSAEGARDLFFEGCTWSGEGHGILMRTDSARGELTIRQGRFLGGAEGLSAPALPDLSVWVANTLISGHFREGLEFDGLHALALENVIFTGNDDALRMTAVTCPVELAQAVFHDNDRAVWAGTDVDLTVRDSIFDGHSCAIDGHSTATVHIDHDHYRAGWIWGGPSYDLDNASVNEGDPMFIDPAAGDFTLAPGSPAIGVGRDGQDLGAFGGPLAGEWVVPEPLDEPVLQSAVFLDGPRHLPVGTTASYRIEGRFNRGYVGDVSAGVSWSSSDPSVLAVDGDGSFEALLPGMAEAIASVDLGGGQAMAEARLNVVVLDVPSLPSGSPPAGVVIRDDDAPLPAEAGVGARMMAEGWSLTDPVDVARSWHAMTALPDGRVMISGGHSGNAILSSVEIYDPLAGTWSVAAPMATPRSRHAAVLLPDGRVLVAGGNITSSNSRTPSAELYDPAADSWTPAAPLLRARYWPTATVLADGWVLVTGGNEGTSSTVASTAELYDPVNDRWIVTGPMTGNRVAHTATLLPDGQVLVVDNDGLEVFDPADRGWSSRAQAPRNFSAHTATLLRDGRVLVAGGYPLDEPQTYFYDPDPDVDAWIFAGDLSAGRAEHDAVLLADGRVLLAGGDGDGGRPLATEIFDPAAPAVSAWVSAGELSSTRRRHAMALLASGEVLLASGNGEAGETARCDLFRPSLPEMTPAAALTEPRFDAALTTLADGRALVAGGRHAGLAASVEVYDGALDTWTTIAPLGTAGDGRGAILLPDGNVLVVGPFVAERLDLDTPSPTWKLTGPRTVGGVASPFEILLAPLTTGEVLAVSTEGAETYDPETDAWAATGPTGVARRAGGTLSVLPTGEVLLVGGRDLDIGSTNGSTLATAEIYDPRARIWRPTAGMASARRRHVAAILPSGDVLVAGGDDGELILASAEIFDARAEEWRPASSMSLARRYGAMAVLPSGEALAVGGSDGTVNLTSTERYDPQTGVWRSGPTLGHARQRHGVAVLGSGALLVVGGRDDEERAVGPSERLPVSGDDQQRPVISAISGSIRYGEAFTVSGSGFGGGPEAHGGRYGHSAMNHPVLALRSIATGRVEHLRPEPRQAIGFDAPAWHDDPMTLTVRSFPPGLEPGLYWLTVSRAGVVSERVAVTVACSLAITRQPTDQVSALGATATFSVASEGGVTYQWRRDGVPIAGAVAPAYTTPPIGADDAGAVYDVVVANGCVEVVSAPAVLGVVDTEPPDVTVESPGGQIWILPVPDAPPEQQIISWTMSDAVRICRVAVALEYQVDDAWLPIPGDANGVVQTFDTEPCAPPGLTVQNHPYQLGASQPSGLLDRDVTYRVRVEARDFNGNEATAYSASFVISKADLASIKTLILTNSERLKQVLQQTSTEEEAQIEIDSLNDALEHLAAHQQVEGLVIDLHADGECEESCSALEMHYHEWDESLAGDPLTPGAADHANRKANAVLFAPHGIHARLRAELERFTAVEYLVIVGDDRIIPMARIPDGATLYDEFNYLYRGESFDGKLDPDQNLPTTVAAKSRLFLTDDPLAVDAEIDIGNVTFSLFLPDVAVGRLVETPEEMRTAIDAFSSRQGVVKLGDRERKVLVSGYDFLEDSARSIERRWRRTLDAVGDPVAVDGVRIGPGWDGDALLETMCGGGQPAGVMSFNGHAHHHGEGYPYEPMSGQQGPRIFGLDAARLIEPNVCSPHGPLDLTGRVIYSVGCHGGLTVPGSESGEDPGNTRDLPQTYLGLGAVAYVANSGYGWGLQHGVGYSERLMQIMTEELTAGARVAVGKAVMASKLRYYLENHFLDHYDLKTLMQWTVYGLPMVEVELVSPSAATTTVASGVGTPPSVPSSMATIHGPGSAAELTAETFGGTSGLPASGLPDHLVVTELRINLSSNGIYKKLAADGSLVTDPGCDPDTYVDGCYYTLNELAAARGTGTGDLPILPYLVYDSRLAGTSQHGVLWKGGAFVEETPWKPVIGTLTSNGGEPVPTPAPEQVILDPVETRWPLDDADCRPTDRELNSLAVSVGEVLPGPRGEDYGRHRYYEDVQLEVFYLGADSLGGCDREGPEIGPGPGGSYHTRTGARIAWTVPASDEAGVWRVIVVVDDGLLDTSDPEAHRGQWKPVELELDAADGAWHGSFDALDSDVLRYVIQAVDYHGNVRWLSVGAGEQSDGQAGTSENGASENNGIDFRCREPSIAPGTTPGRPVGALTPSCLPEVVPVTLDAAEADLSVELMAASGAVVAGSLFEVRILVGNASAETASAARVSLHLPAGFTVAALPNEAPWTCAEGADAAMDCVRPFLEAGESHILQVSVQAPEATGPDEISATVSSAGVDPDDTNNRATAGIFVVSPTEADLAVTVGNGMDAVVAGEAVVYEITVRNHGPRPLGELFLFLDAPLLVASTAEPQQGSYDGKLWQGLSLGVDGKATLMLDGTVPEGPGMLSIGSLTVGATISTPSGIDDPNGANNSAADEDEIVASVPSSIRSVTTVADTGDAVLEAGEETTVAVTQLLVGFAGSVTGADEPGAFQLVGAGADGILATAPCEPVGGDDQPWVLAATYRDEPEPTAALSWEGVDALPRGRYELAVCSQVKDATGEPLLDLPWTRAFTVRAEHRLVNPNLDSDLDLWEVTASPGASAMHAEDDAGQQPTSGSVQLTGGAAGESVSISQCIELGGDESLRLGGKIRMLSTETGGAVTLTATTFDQSGCAGSTLTDRELASETPIHFWHALDEVSLRTPADARSIRVTYGLETGDAAAPVVLLDDLYVFESKTIFADGFESGNGSAWSASVP